MELVWNYLVTFFCYFFALLGIGKVGTTGNFQNNAWMKNIADTTYISEISMPGTHDSCAYYEPIFNTAAVQEYSVTDQLNMGVRYLDLRCAMGVGAVNVVHSVIFQMDTLRNVMSKVTDFLRENPSETVVVSVKQDVHIGSTTRSAFSSVIKDVIDDNIGYYFTENYIPTLGEARGKIVFINRFDEEFSYGLNTLRWVSGSGLFRYETFNLLAQDDYYVESYDAKWNIFTKYLDEASALTPEQRKNTICLNFLSGNQSNGQQQTVSAELNNRFLAYADNGNLSDKFTGILVFDFINSKICNAIIHH